MGLIETGDEQRAKARADEQDRFERWMKAVDLELIMAIGFGSSDLADQPYREFFDDGMDHREAAEYVLGEEGLLD